jgi:hypothetical protein
VGKLAESYIEFVAKGLEETESAIKGVEGQSKTAHKATAVLAESFKNYGQRNREALQSTTLQATALKSLSGQAKAMMLSSIGLEVQTQKLITLEKSLENSLLKTSEGFRFSALEIQRTTQKQKLFAAENQAIVAKMMATDKACIALTAAEMGVAKSTEQAAKTLGLNAQALRLKTGETEKALQADMKLQGQELALITAEKSLENSLLKTNASFQKQALAIANSAGKQKLFAAENQALVAKMQAVDKEAIKLAATEVGAAKATDIATRSLSLNAAQSQVASGATKALMQEEMRLKESEAKLSEGQKSLESLLLKTDKAFRTSANNIANLASKEKLLGAESQLLVAKMQATDKEAVKLAAAEMKASQATDIATKKLQLEARQLNLSTGAFKETTKAAAALAAMEEKIAAKEMKVVSKVSKPAAKEEKASKELAPVVKGGKTEIKVDTKSLPAAEKGIAAITGTLQKMQVVALVVGGAIGGAVGTLTRAASAGTVEGEQLAKSYEYAGRVVGDMFAPYVRLATDLVNRFTAYFKTLSASTKASIANWAMVTAAVAAFAALIPTLLAGVAALSGAVFALLSPIGLAGAAIVAMAGYFAGVFDATKSWEEVLASFIEFFLDAWTRAGDAFDKFCGGVVSQYDSTVKPMLEGMEESWNSVSESIGGVVDYLAESIASFFGTSVEDASSFEGVMSTVVEAWLDLQTAADAVISALSDGFMWIYEKAVKPTISFILDAFKLVWGYVKEVADGIFGAFEDATGGIISSVGGAIKFMFSSWKNFTSVVVSLIFTIAEKFAEIVNTISALWWGMINKLAKAAAWIMEKMGLISKDTADKMRQAGKGDTDIFDTAAMRKKMDSYLDGMQVGMEENKKKAKEVGAAISDFVNPPVGNELGKRLEENTERAKKMARAIVGTIKGGLEKPGGFQIKANVSMEGLGATFDRLQLAFANNVGPNIDKAQLGEMKGINANMQIAAAALVTIKDKVPAVR